MDISLEKIDILRDRMGLSYKEAKEYLEKHNGNVLEVLMEFEENQKTGSKNISDKGEKIVETLKEAIRKGNVTRILVKKNTDIIMNIPITAGAIGAVISPPVTAVGVVAALLSKCTIELVQENGKIVNINELGEKTIDKVKSATQRSRGNTGMEKE